VITGCCLYRVIDAKRTVIPLSAPLEPLGGGFTTYKEGLAALNDWVTFLESGGTVEGMRWICWHQVWADQIIKYFENELLPWCKSHPEREQQAIVQMRKHSSAWVGAATVEAARMPELLEYAAGCGKVLKIYVGGYTKDEVMAIVAAETIGKTPAMLARMDDDELKELFCKVTSTRPVETS
jgi:hypothetical protein